MSKKRDFNKGIEAGLRISENILKKEEKAIDYIADKLNSISDSHDELKNAVNKVLDYLNTQAAEQYYGIIHRHNPMNMREEEKKVVLDILTTLASQQEDYGEEQKKYLINLRHALELTNYTPNTNYDYDNIDNIRDLDDQEVIITCIYEFLFLQNNDFAFLDEYEDLLECFSIKPKKLKEIKCIIDITYYMFDTSGIIEAYGNHVIVNTDEEDEEPVGEIALEHLKIGDKEILKGETEEWINKILEIDGEISCKGNIVIRDSIICIANNSNGYISLYNGGNITISSSVIRGTMERRGKYYIYGDCENVHISDCCFNSVNEFIFAREGKVTILNSEINNCRSFIVSHDCDIFNCRFYFDNESIKQVNSCFDSDVLSIAGEISNCHFEFADNLGKNEQSEDKTLGLIHHLKDIYAYDRKKTLELKISNSTFLNVHTIMTASRFENCVFKKCTNILHYINDGDLHIIDSYFEECKYIIGFACIDDSFCYIENCQFFKCISCIKFWEGARIKQCSFVECENTDNAYESLIVIDKVSPNKKSSVEQCLFYKCDSKADYLIRGDEFNKASDSFKLDVSRCHFYKCETQNETGCFVKTQYSVDGIFGSKKVVDKIWSDQKYGNEDIDVAIEYPMKKNRAGKYIGAEKEVSGRPFSKKVFYINGLY